MIFQFPIYLEHFFWLPGKPIYQETRLDPWFQIHSSNWKMRAGFKGCRRCLKALKINILNFEPKNEGLVQMMFLFKEVIFRFKTLIFQSVQHKIAMGRVCEVHVLCITFHFRYLNFGFLRPQSCFDRGAQRVFRMGGLAARHFPLRYSHPRKFPT